MPAKEPIRNNSRSLSRRQGSQAENVTSHEQDADIQRVQVAHRLITPGDVLQLQRTIGNRAVAQILAQTTQRHPKSNKDQNVQRQVVQRVTVIAGISVRGGSMPTWDQDGVTYHINLTTDTSHVTQEGIPKIHYFFQGTGKDIKDKRPTSKEQGGSSKKKVKVKGQKSKKVKTKQVFSNLPSNVQNFIKTNFTAILNATG